MSRYGYSKVVSYSFDEAVEKIITQLKEKSFGVLCDIDVQKAFKEKIGKDINKYRILGACNPSIAYEALQIEEELGLLLPCNVIVYEKGAEVVVSVISPEKLLEVSGNTALNQPAQKVGELLRSAVDAL